MEFVSLSERDLKTIHPYLDPLNVEVLFCSFNKLKKLPNLPKVRHLECNYNKLRSLPKLPSIIYLSCHNNNLKSIPNIKDMCIHNNKIKDFSRHIKYRTTNKYLSRLRIMGLY
jgi:Leucine-rich repeat (LRR) protein